MITYTTLSDDIYFLTDKSIVSSLDDPRIGSTLNPVVSYNTIKGISSDVSSNVTRIDSVIDTKVSLSDNNELSGNNTFNGTTTFKSTVLFNDTTILCNDVNAYFSKFYNNDSGKLSSLHNIDQIKTVQNLYRIVDEIIIEAGIEYVKVDYTENFGDLIDKIKNIIRKEPTLSSNYALSTFVSNTYDETRIKDVLDALEIIINTLPISKYSLAEKLRSIENSIDSLDSYFSNKTQMLSGKIDSLSGNIKDISGNLTTLNNDTQLCIGNVLSVINSLSDTISSQYALSSEVPLSTSQLINDGTSGNTFLLNSNVTLSSGYDGDNYMLCLILNGTNTLIAEMNANNFVKDGMLSSVELLTNDKTPGNWFLRLTWNTEDKTPIDVPLSSLVNNLYTGENGISVNNFVITPNYETFASELSIDDIFDSIKDLSDYTSETFEEISSDISSVLYNVASYNGHIDINLDSDDVSLSSISAVFHAKYSGHEFIKNGTIFDVQIKRSSSSSNPYAIAELTCETSDSVKLHDKDFIIIHESTGGRLNIPLIEITPDKVKTITAVDWPKFNSLCCTVSSDFFSLKRSNIISNENQFTATQTFSNISIDNGYANYDSLSIDFGNLFNTNTETSAYDTANEFIIQTCISVDGLSNILNNKISIDNGAIGINGININHISQDEYYVLVNSPEGPLSNTLYIVSANEMNMYGERITNLADPISASDATTRSYVVSSMMDLSNDLTSEISAISSALQTSIENKIIIDGHALTNEALSVNHISLSDYYELVNSKPGPLSNTLYIVSANEMNMYNEKIENLADGTISSDAVNLGQLCSYVNDERLRAASVEREIISDLTSEVTRSISVDNILCTDIGILSTDSSNKIWIDNIRATSLSICHISQDEYHNKVLTTPDDEISNMLFIVSSDNHNAYGKRITNLSCNPDQLKDAATVEYVNDKISSESNLNMKDFAKMIYDSLSSTGISAGANIGDLNAQQPILALLNLANVLCSYLAV